MSSMEPTPELLASLRELAKLILSEETLETTLKRVADLSVRAIPSCDSAGLTLPQDGGFHTPVTSDDLAKVVDEVQYQAGEGPCLASVASGEVNKIDVMEEETRWPRFTRGTVAAGVASSLSVPMRVDGTTGALNLYSLTRNGFSQRDVEIAHEFASQAAVAIANASVYAASRALTEQLNIALQTRDVIGQAKGILMEREGIGDQEAFDMLRIMSQKTNIKLREVAERLVREHSAAEGGKSRPS